MEITFNGKSKEIPAGTSIMEFLDQMQLDCMQVVVERNHIIIPRQRLAETVITPGDTLEVIHFVGGG